MFNSWAISFPSLGLIMLILGTLSHFASLGITICKSGLCSLQICPAVACQNKAWPDSMPLPLQKEKEGYIHIMFQAISQALGRQRAVSGCRMEERGHEEPLSITPLAPLVFSLTVDRDAHWYRWDGGRRRPHPCGGQGSLMKAESRQHERRVSKWACLVDLMTLESAASASSPQAGSREKWMSAT